MTPEPTYLGVDPSLNATGLCAVTKGAATIVQTIHPKRLRGMPRLAYIKAALVELLVLTKPTFGAFENYSYDSVGRVFQLGEIGGVLRLTAFEQQLIYVDVAPSALKKFATGKPDADKAMVMSAVKDKWHIAVADDNQADAFILAAIAQGLQEGLTAPTRPQLEVLHRIRNPIIKTPVRARKRIKHFL